MAKLILLRHGQSTWNLENRFTGWVDIPLTEQGVVEARESGEKLLAAGIVIQEAYTSVLRRAIDTLEICLKAAQQEDLPVTYNQALNERHYGDLQGLNKAETAQKFGDAQVMLWRRSYDVRPPNGESLKDTAARTLPYYQREILPKLQAGNCVLVSAHGNSLRAIVMALDNLSEEAVVALNIPNGVPIIYEIGADGLPASKTEL
ncbi:MAG: 2,3-bisphosphoglycerate-dependent phosphoglycerate mutase [Armatimonadetes bacterium]|nr:2,3-bisphosphoglycerate-dependent phosphoglycerate mutase [Armatimonadota bacterium]MDE2205953.1 2,3-bisphosphoglycerate-dependent phosphoglycerate mutase [Armatimonadota bacterium]